MVFMGLEVCWECLQGKKKYMCEEVDISLLIGSIDHMFWISESLELARVPCLYSDIVTCLAWKESGNRWSGKKFEDLENSVKSLKSTFWRKMKMSMNRELILSNTINWRLVKEIRQFGVLTVLNASRMSTLMDFSNKGIDWRPVFGLIWGTNSEKYRKKIV